MQHKYHWISLTSGAQACSFSHDGNFLVIGQNNGEILLVDVISFKVVSKKRDRNVVIHDIK